jgi:outer membrane protein OmpA-like peptidoglycan-associated protein
MAGPAARSFGNRSRLSLGADGIALSGPATSESAADALADLAEEAGGRGIAVTNSVVGPVSATRQKLADVKGLAGVKFNRGSEVLTAGSKKTLNAAAKIIRAMPAGVRVEIRGHTDNKGDAALNARLSKRRADAVRKYLISRGVPANRLSAKGFGEKSPRASNGTDKGRAANRRIEFVVKGS